mmetsp:Transcript_11142/g.35439  ORF Transcript_11142/g.35439 Transcript_11142/m.35439 type:complete len:270 (-) Transcript_11142:56-865(-)
MKTAAVFCLAWLFFAFSATPIEGIRDMTSCNREKSRLVRHLVEERIFPVASALSLEFSDDCPFHPGHDAFRDHEEHKTEVRGSLWKCEYCRKAFRTEGYLDRHMERRHMDRVPTVAPVCLADYCDALDCRNDRAQLTMLPRCDKMEIRLLRRDCESVFHKCFPPAHSASVRLAHDALITDFCAGLACHSPTGTSQGNPARRVGPTVKRASEEGPSSLIVVVAVVLLTATAILYGVLFCVRPRKLGTVSAVQMSKRRAWWSRFLGSRKLD